MEAVVIPVYLRLPTGRMGHCFTASGLGLFLIFLFHFTPLLTSTALALDIPVSFNAGRSNSDLDKGDYDPADGKFYTASAHFRYLSLELGYQDIGRFNIETSENTHVDVAGFTVGGLKRFQLKNWFSTDLKLGLLAWEAKATLLDEKVGEDRGTNLWVGVTANLHATKIFGLFLGWQWFFDISEANISTASLGLSLNF